MRLAGCVRDPFVWRGTGTRVGTTEKNKKENKVKKLWIGIMVVVAVLAGTAQAKLLAEFTFDADASDTVGGHDGILSSATVSNGVLTLDAGGYMDLAATFGAVNPFGGSSDFRIELDYKTTGGCCLISSATVGQNPDLTADLSVWIRGNRDWLYYDNYYIGDPHLTSSNFKSGTWQTLLITYDADGTDATTPLVTVTSGGVSLTSTLNPGRDASLDTVRLGGSIQADMDQGSVAGMAFDNIRIYGTVVPEPTTIGMLGLSGLIPLFFFRRRLVR